jgi:hypothetical protein
VLKCFEKPRLQPSNRATNSNAASAAELAESGSPDAREMCDHCDQTLYPFTKECLSMPARTQRTTVNLSAFPDLVVIYLGMRVRTLRGLKTVFSFGPKISAAVAAKPEGLLLHENVFFSVYPLHIGMRQYWRDFQSLENWARSLPHQQWWQEFLRDSGGVGFWHETYFMRGGMEAIYDDLKAPVGFSVFAPNQPAQGPMFSARKRLGLSGDPAIPAPVSEDAR